MNYYITFIYFLVFIKFAFLISIIFSKLLQHKKTKTPQQQEMTDKLTNMSNKFELIFDILMASLLIYLFHPGYKFDISLLTFETRILLFSYGIILFLNFIKNSI